MPPDIVFVVGPGDREQLRYALRSLTNAPHGKVFIAGMKPSWVRNVVHVPVPQRGSKFRSSTNNLYAACQHDRLSNRFVYMNDDFFVVRPITRWPVYHWGPMSRVERFYKTGGRQAYLRGLRQTCELIRRWTGIDDSLSYETHTPLPMNKYRFIAMIDRVREEAPHIDALFKRSLYGALYNIGGQQTRDAKSMDGRRFNKNALFLSSTNGQFRGRPIERFLQQRFPRKSIYEA